MSVQPAQPSLLEAMYAARDTQRIREEAERYGANLHEFVQAAWHVIEPNVAFLDNWHIRVVCEHLEACSRGEIEKLTIWLPRGMMKSRAVSVLWPAWEWSHNAWMRFFTVSYDLRLAGRLAADTRTVVQSNWYQERWGGKFNIMREGERYLSNDQGGTRLATAPGSSALGEHANRVIIDDIINADDAEANSGVVMNAANAWYDATIPGTRIKPYAEVIVQQRLAETDLPGHVLDQEGWRVLCLPERFEAKHPFVYPDDPRVEGELLWPERRDEKASKEMERALRASHRIAGQMQQRPEAREGNMLLRDWWRFYDPRIRAQEDWAKLPKFTTVVLSVDCPQKDKETNDNVAIQCWGIVGADRYLLDFRLGKMNYNLAKRTVKEMAVWSRRIWRCYHALLIEQGGYGIELVDDLKRDLTGVTKISPGKDGDKVMRAEAASDALESGNCFLPGFGPPWQPAYDEGKSPADVVELINNFARFPNVAHDDDIDSWSQAMNWARNRVAAPMRTSSALKNLAQRVRV